MAQMKLAVRIAEKWEGSISLPALPIASFGYNDGYVLMEPILHAHHTDVGA